QTAQAPIFLLLDLAAFAFDDGLEMGGECVHLLRADVLARDQEMLIKSHLLPFPYRPRNEAGRVPVFALARPGRATIAQTLRKRAPADHDRLRGGSIEKRCKKGKSVKKAATGPPGPRQKQRA